MSLNSCYENELAIIEEEFANGDIDVKEYNRLVGELEQDMRDYHR